MKIEPLAQLVEGMAIPFGGDQLTYVDAALAQAFRPGDALQVVQTNGTLLHIPAAIRQLTRDAVTDAQRAFRDMGDVSDEQISAFFEGFAGRLEDDGIWEKILEANQQDAEKAKAKGRSTTRLIATNSLRDGMVAGLRGWIDAPTRRGQVCESVPHEGWKVDLVGAALGVVAFVFEGRPNVVADATGVLRGGNTVVFRIGSDALGTARAMMTLALRPALADAGLPENAVVLVDSAAHAAAWSLFSDARLGLAVARGSGHAVETLGALAQQSGIPVSLHGTGGAWMVASSSATVRHLEAAIFNSLDRKVCNTLNVICLNRASLDEQLPATLAALENAAARRGQNFKLHVVDGDQSLMPEGLFSHQVRIVRADGEHQEAQAELLPERELGREWEWEESPEVTLKVVDCVDTAVELFNRYSPQFVASLVSSDPAEHERFFARVNAPFVGNGFTRWVDGQYALLRPELGLSNWQNGRLLGRGAVLSGDSVFTVRAKVTQSDPDVGR